MIPVQYTNGRGEKNKNLQNIQTIISRMFTFHHQIAKEIMMGRNYRALKEKKCIAVEAYAVPNNIKSTTRKYNTDAKSIRKWKAVIHEVVPHERHEVVTRNDIMKYYKKETLRKGCPSFMMKEQRHHLLDFFETHRRTGMAITIAMMTMELILWMRQM